MSKIATVVAALQSLGCRVVERQGDSGRVDIIVPEYPGISLPVWLVAEADHVRAAYCIGDYYVLLRPHAEPEAIPGMCFDAQLLAKHIQHEVSVLAEEKRKSLLEEDGARTRQDAAEAALAAAMLFAESKLHRYVKIDVVMSHYNGADAENLRVLLGSGNYDAGDRDCVRFLVPNKDAANFALELSALLRKYRQ